MDGLDVYAQSLGIPLALFFLLIVWTLVWKALAAWRSARLNQPVWFIFLFVLNTFGILEILYLFVFSRKDKIKVKKAKKRR